MTLIAGLQCVDGLLLCCDREEGDGASKTSVKKIFDSADPCQFAIATSGYAALADVCVKRIKEAARAAGSKFRDRHEEVIEEVLRAVFTKYVWAEIPNAEDREIALIIGLYDASSQQYQMYLSCEEILQPKSDYVCAGCGEELGEYFLGRLYEESLTVHEAMRLMAFVCREVKDSSAGCGGESEMVSITPAGTSRTVQTMAADRNIPCLAECMKPFWKRNQGTAKIADVGHQKIHHLKT